jgi:toxin ParE1/3/4
MGFKIVWSKFAETQLDEIYEYYETKASARIAKKLLKDIINEPNKLMKAPTIGQVEELLKDRKECYRYLVFKNYKIIYSIEEEAGLIKIADIFNTRLNPTKIARSK